MENTHAYHHCTVYKRTLSIQSEAINALCPISFYKDEGNEYMQATEASTIPDVVAGLVVRYAVAIGTIEGWNRANPRSCVKQKYGYLEN